MSLMEPPGASGSSEIVPEPSVDSLEWSFCGSQPGCPPQQEQDKAEFRGFQDSPSFSHLGRPIKFAAPETLPRGQQLVMASQHGTGTDPVQPQRIYWKDGNRKRLAALGSGTPRAPNAVMPSVIRITKDTLHGRNFNEATLMQQLATHDGTYQPNFSNMADARAWRNTYMGLSRRPPELITTPATDATFPRSEADERLLKQRLFSNIVDWSCFDEYKMALGGVNGSEWKEWIEELRRRRAGMGLYAEDLSALSDEQLRPPPERLPPLEIMWKRVVKYWPSDIEIHLLCWEMLVSLPSKPIYKGRR